MSTTTRTFTDEEQALVVRCLLACRPVVTAEDRALIDGIIVHGWHSKELDVLVHKAEPNVTHGAGYTSWTTRCKHCGENIHHVPGGHGPTWVHVSTGTVARTGAPLS